jgi:MFS transporter, PHS family, inorganic phosphate transporter
LTGSVVTIIVLVCFEKALNQEEMYNQLDAVWRIQMGVALVPAFATLWPRLTMPEGKKFIESRELNHPVSSGASSVAGATKNIEDPAIPSSTKGSEPESSDQIPQLHETLERIQDSSSVQETKLEMIDSRLADSDSLKIRKAKLDAFFVYFREWRHMKALLGTMLCWFLLDIAFYGTNLNQSVLLQEIGFATGKNEYDVLKRTALGNLIIAAAGYVPGYFFTVYFIEILGRRWIQIQGFLICALMFAILAGDYAHLGTAGKFVCFAIAQVMNVTV